MADGARVKNPNRGIVLSLADAYALHRWLELLIDDRRFFNPIDCYEAEKAFKAAKSRLQDKLVAHANAHRELQEQP
jgi:hypothetical protein